MDSAAMRADPACPDDTLLEDLLLGRLGDLEAGPLEDHLAGCDRCAAQADTMHTDDRLTQAMRIGSPLVTPEGVFTVEPLVAALRPRLAADLRQIGAYRVLKLLGTGGMGVVYLARHDRLPRLAAVKLLSGVGRSDRFLREAGMLARVRHPNVVQLYEVGEWPGPAGVPTPFFAMEYVDGGTLADRLADGPLAPREAAVCLEALAAGAQAAHEAGVVHRDLKPANVLLQYGTTKDTKNTKEDEDSSPFRVFRVFRGSLLPKITDFGLGRVQDDDGLTRTGAILGTPGYMAPEQAAGSSDVGPAADVYALGAILYECLTGRPPFQGATALETLDLARRQDPVPPRQLRGGIPADLDVICLKCLEKEPGKRYPTAQALADDLRRHLDGVPILARPVGFGERLVKWVRRHPAPAAVAGVVLLAAASLVTGAVVYESRLRTALEASRQEGQRADDNSRKAREALRKILQRTRDRRWSDVPRLQQLQREQLEDALGFFEAVARQQADDPAARHDVAWALVEAAKVQRTLGKTDDARANLRRADDLTAALLAQKPDAADLRLLRGDVLLTVGVEEWKVEPIQQAVECLDQLVRDHPTHPQGRTYLLNSLLSLSAWLHLAKRDAEAEPVLLRAVEQADALVAAGGSDDALAARAKARVNLAAVYRRLPGKDVRGTNALAEADLERFHARNPVDWRGIDALAVHRINRAYDLAAEGQPQLALDDVSRNLPMLEAALKREPEDTGVRRRLQFTHGVRATMQEKLGRPADAAGAWEQMMAVAPAAERFGHRLTLVQLLLDAKDHARAAEQVAVLDKELGPATPAAVWKRVAGYYAKLADAATATPSLAARYRAAEKDVLARTPKKP